VLGIVFESGILGDPVVVETTFQSIKAGLERNQ
jgi:hypothetical protein